MNPSGDFFGIVKRRYTETVNEDLSRLSAIG
jgi:hypothetical protein